MKKAGCKQARQRSQARVRVRRPETYGSKVVVELKPQRCSDAFACAANLVPKGLMRYMSRRSHIRKGALRPPTEE